MVKKTILKNGLRVVTKYMPNLQSVTVLVLVGAGSRYETKKLNGISHFLEHMFFKGAKKYRNTKEVSEAIDSVGGDFNAFTGKEYAGYYVKVASEKVSVAIDVLSDMLINSKFDPAEIDKERGVILEEYNMYQDTPMYQIGWDFERLMFGDHPLGWDQVGTKELISSVKQKDFLEHLNSLYTPDNIVVSVAGNFEEKEIIKQVEKLFVFGKERKKKSFEFEPFKEYSDDKKILLRNKKTEQAHVVIGFPGYADDSPKYYASRLLSVIMGGNMSSRMFLNVREANGLAYYINTTTDEYFDAGTISTNAGVSVDRAEQAVNAIIEQYKIASQENIKSYELDKAKAFLKGKIILRLEDSEEYSHLIAKSELLHEKSESLEDVLKKIDEVTIDQITEVAIDLFQESKMRLALIGPFDDEEKFVRLMNFK